MKTTPPNRLRELRRVQKLSQDDIAEQLGVDPSVVDRMERGEEPIPDEFAKPLADLFGVSVVWLLGQEGASS